VGYTLLMNLNLKVLLVKISHELLLRFEVSSSINIDYGTFRCSCTRDSPKAASILPIPCPINSRLLLCRVFVILSAITEVNKEYTQQHQRHILLLRCMLLVV
jgi:hypothetical protein